MRGLRGEGLSGVEDEEDQVGALDFRGGVGDGLLLDGVIRGAKAGGVDEHDGQAVEIGQLADPVARGAGDIRGDDSLLGEELIGKCGFADVGGADDGDARRMKEPVEGPVGEDGLETLGIGRGLKEVFPGGRLGEEGTKRQIGAGEREIGEDFLLEGIVGIEGFGGEWGAEVVQDMEAGAGGEIEDGSDDPQAPMEADVGEAVVRGEDDDGIVEDGGRVSEVAMDGSARGERPGEMVAEEPGHSRAEEADDGDGGAAGGCEEDREVGGGHGNCRMSNVECWRWVGQGVRFCV